MKKNVRKGEGLRSMVAIQKAFDVMSWSKII